MPHFNRLLMLSLMTALPWIALSDEGPTTGQFIDNRYVIVLDGDPLTAAQAQLVTTRHALITQVENDMGGQVVFEYAFALNGFTALLTAEMADALRANPLVKYVEQDRVATAIGEQPNPPSWGLDRIDARSGYNDNYRDDADGSAVDVYVIDTGIQGTHADFGGRVVGGADFVGNFRSPAWVDGNGHGTHVAGTIAGEEFGLAKNANLYAVRVLGDDGSGAYSGIIAGIDWMVENRNGPSVANMSVGGPAFGALDDAVNNAVRAGVSMVAAAGNENQDACNVSPARAREAITVGATDEGDNRASFSNFGACLDIFGPGVNITSAWIGSDNATNTISGTSMAAPHIAGIATLYLDANPDASSGEVADAILSGSTQGIVNNAGPASPNLFGYSLLTEEAPPPEPEPNPDCSGESFSGALTTTSPNHYAYVPGAAFYSGTGEVGACLSGPASANFDLRLYEYDRSGARWTLAAEGTSSNSEETIAYNGATTHYIWLVYTRAGAGAYTLRLR